jgi:hypothetical protein
MGSTHYIDFLTKKDLTAPVMRFTDKLNRVGIAMKICKKDIVGAPNDQDFCIFTLFRRYTNANTWAYHESFSSIRSSILQEQQKMHAGSHIGGKWDECPTCPKSPGDDLFGFAENLLNGKEIAFKVVGDVTQVCNPLLVSVQAIAVQHENKTLVQRIAEQIHFLFCYVVKKCITAFYSAKNMLLLLR